MPSFNLPSSEEQIRVPANRAAARATSASDFWTVAFAKQPRSTARSNPDQQALHSLVERVMGAPGVELFDAIEAGVPTSLVGVIARATGAPEVSVLEFLGLSATTFRRKSVSRQSLPDIAGHRAMGYLRVLATLRRLLAESGDPEALAEFDLEVWAVQWMREELPEFGGKTPAEMLRNPEGQRAVEELLERMRGGLPA